MSHTAFFYGTLMAPPVLRRVIYGVHAPTLDTGSLVVRPAVLHQFQRHKVSGADYPAIIPSIEPGACVRGSLVSGLSDADMWRLDIFEGSEYKRQQVEVREEDGDRVVTAETYVWIAGADCLETEEWDFEEFVKEKMVRWMGGGPAADQADQGFQDVDDAVATTKATDPTGGRGAHGDITRALDDALRDEEQAWRSAA